MNRSEVYSQLPTIFQARCDHCNFSSNVFPSGYGAVFVDEPREVQSRPVIAGGVVDGGIGQTQFAEQSDPRLVALAHPIEHHILSQTGYTWNSLALAGRYVWVRYVVCQNCGTLFGVRRLTCPPTFGCSFGCIFGLVCGIAVGVCWQNFWLGFATAYGSVLLAVCVASTLGWAYTRLRFRERARKIDSPRSCPHCESHRYVGVENRGVFPCPQCSEKSMRIRSVGIS